MANLHDCLDRAVAAGELDNGRAEAAKTEFGQLVERYEQAMPRHQAEAAAGRDLREATRRAQRSRRHAVLNQLQAMVRLEHLVLTADAPERAVLALLEPRADDGFRGESVRFSQEALRDQIRTDLKGFLEQAGLNVIGSSRDKALVTHVVRELHGQDTGSAAARSHADAIRKVQKRLRQMFNAHGGDIGEIADYGMRHTHDGSKILAAQFDEWSDFVFDRLDWHRIVDLNTGRPFANEGGRPSRAIGNAFLQKIYDTVTSDGFNKLNPSMSVGAKALYNRRAEPRVLHFQNGDAWMEYNDRFGSTDLFSGLVGGLDAMARDIGLMRVLSPNPNLGLEYAIQVMQKAAKTSGDAGRIKLADANAKKARVMLAHLNGAINSPVNETMAKVFSNVRHFNVATRLGAALLSSVTDVATVSIGAAAAGRNPANILSTGVSLLASGASRAQAARAGFTAETLFSIGTSSARLTNDVVANDVFSRMSGFTIRATGLSYWTDQWRVAVQMDFAGELADNVSRGFDDVETGTRRILERNGITAQDWDALRAGGLFEPQPGATFLSPFWWLEHQTALSRPDAESLAIRLQGAFRDQLETMVPTRRIRGTAAIMGETKPGTAGGELLRSTLGFKNYAVSFTIGQIAAFNSLASPMHKAGYLAASAAAFTVLGVLAIQLKEIAKGRDPRPIDDPAIWLAGVAQGGGLGIFGDFFFAEENRFGGGLAETVAGPVVGLAGDVIRAGSSNLKRAASGDESLIGRDTSNLFRNNVPFASSAWYGRVAFDRLVADQLQQMLDPDAERQFRSEARRLQRDFGTQHWWERGQSAPERGPDISNAFGGP